MKNRFKILLLSASVACSTAYPDPLEESEQETSADLDFNSARSVEGELAETAQRQREGVLAKFKDRKDRLEARIGLILGVDNHTHYLDTDSDGSPDDAASNVTRLYGTWTAPGRGTSDDAALIFKIENRTALGNHVSTQTLGALLGYAGTFASTYSEAGVVLTNLYWRQRFAAGRGSFVIGQVDAYDYVNVNALASPWTGFTNLAFQQQSTFAGPSQGLGAAVRWRVDKQWAVLAGFADANADPSEPWDSAKNLFDTGETFKHVAVGWTPDWADTADQLVQLTFWQIDERKEAAIEDGHGVSFTASGRADRWRPFLRASYSDGGGTILEKAVSVGVGYDARGGSDLLGIGVDWGRAADSSINQYTLETFYRYDLSDFVQMTPSIQYVVNPANAPDTGSIFVFGARVRVFF